MAGKAKFKVGQVVRCCNSYFRIKARQYDSTDRVASWDNGWWYYQDDEKRSAYSEHALRPLTQRERGSDGK